MNDTNTNLVAPEAAPPAPEAAPPAVVATPIPEATPAPKPNRKERRAAAKAEKAPKAPKAVKAVKAEKTDEPIKVRRSIVPAKFKAQYAKHNDTCGDKLALVLKKATTTVNSDGRETLDVKALRDIAKANGIDFSRYEALNNGQKRMNVSNKMRGMLKNDEKVVIGTQTFASTKALVKPTEQAAA